MKDIQAEAAVCNICAKETLWGNSGQQNTASQWYVTPSSLDWGKESLTCLIIKYVNLWIHLLVVCNEELETTHPHLQQFSNKIIPPPSKAFQTVLSQVQFLWMLSTKTFYCVEIKRKHVRSCFTWPVTCLLWNRQANSRAQQLQIIFCWI